MGTNTATKDEFLLDALRAVQVIMTKRKINMTDYLEMTEKLRQAIKVLETGKLESWRWRQ